MIPREQPLWLHGEGFQMLGIASQPAQGAPAQRLGVLIVVGGAQYRVGSHRQFRQLALCLSEAGFPVLRFDLPGMGDSPGELPAFEDTAPHIAAAIDGLLAQRPELDGVALWGLCDGASASLLYVQATQDPRVAGLALLNPWVRSEAGEARARVKHYYRQRLMEPAFWRKLLAGGVGWQALRGLLGNLRRMRQPAGAPAASSFQQRMALGWRGFKGPILLLLSGRDLTAQEFAEHAGHDPHWAGALAQPGLSTHRLTDADHTCSQAAHSREVGELSRDWLMRFATVGSFASRQDRPA